MNDKLIAVEFVTGESNAKEFVADIEQSGGELKREAESWTPPAELIDDYADAQFDPLMLVAAAVSVGFLIKRVSDIWLDHTRPGGQVIDANGDVLVVRVAPYLKRGTLVVNSKDGVKVFQPEEKDQALSLLEKVISADG